MKKLLIIITLAIIGIIWLDLSESGYTIDSNRLNTSNYKTYVIDDIENKLDLYIDLSKQTNTNNDFEVIDISKLSGKLYSVYAYYNQYTNNVILDIYNENVTKPHRILVLDNKGKIIGNVASKNNYRIIQNYLLSLNEYYQINSSSISDKLEYKDISNSIKTPQDILDIYQKSKIFTFFSTQNYDVKTYLFFIDNTWKKIIVPEKMVKKHLTRKPFFIIKNLNDLTTLDFTKKPDPNLFKVRLDYFDKDKYFKEIPNQMWHPTGGGRPGFWTGTGYYSLIKGNKTFRFKIPNDKMYTTLKYTKYTFKIRGKVELPFMILRTNEELGYIIRERI